MQLTGAFSLFSPCFGDGLSIRRHRICMTGSERSYVSLEYPSCYGRPEVDDEDRIGKKEGALIGSFFRRWLIVESQTSHFATMESLG